MAQTNTSEKRKPDEPSYDAIVIGSGMGALAFAALMAKLRKWRVLVLERHFKIGGFTHTFSRPGGWTWDVGVHYVGDMGRGMDGRRLFDFITDGRVDWAPLPDVYDVFVYPGLTLKVPKGRANFERALVEHFPSERQAIGKYFRDIKRATNWFTRHIMAMVTPQPVSWIVRAINRMTEQSALQTTYRPRRTSSPDCPRKVLRPRPSPVGCSRTHSSVPTRHSQRIATHPEDPLHRQKDCQTCCAGSSAWDSLCTSRCLQQSH